MAYTFGDINAAQGFYLYTAVDPRVGPGLDYQPGTIVVYSPSAVLSLLLQKQSSSPTDWSLVGGGGPGELSGKAGVVAGSSFAGAPMTASVIFATPFLSSAYAISLTGSDGRIFTYQGKTGAGFTINANSDAALPGEVSWTAILSSNP